MVDRSGGGVGDGGLDKTLHILLVAIPHLI
jgi:hypothetical protein